MNTQYGTLTAGSVTKAASQHDVTAAAGGLTLNDVSVTGTVPAISAGSGSISSSFTTNQFTVDGVDTAHSALGPLSSAKVTSGTGLTASDANADDALVDSAYATQNKLSTGDTIDVGGTSFKIIGIVAAPQGGSPPEVYVPLAKAQAIGTTGSAKLAGQVNTIYVSAASAADIPAVQQELSKALPGATVTDSSDLAGEVTGSLSSASSLASNLGKWLSVAVLIAAFGVASLLTMAAVARRVREFGTLKALGWRSTRVIGQVMGESIVIGIVGAAAGIGLGYVGVTLIDKLAPQLSATVGSAGTSGGTGAFAGFIKGATSTAHTVSVALTAPVTADLIGIAVALAVGGGLIAGLFGGWRAARLRPAAALTKVE